MATQRFYREQTLRRIGQSDLNWNNAKFRTSAQVARTLQVSEATVLEWLKKRGHGRPGDRSPLVYYAPPARKIS